MERSSRRALLGVIGSLVAGPVALGIHWLVFRPPVPMAGEYFLSNILIANYGFLTAGLYLLFGYFAGRFTRVRPVLAALAMVVLFPAVSCYEGERYPGSHNLIPFEFVGHFLMALPAWGGALLGRSLALREFTAKKGVAQQNYALWLLAASVGLALLEHERQGSRVVRETTSDYWGVLAFAPAPVARDSMLQGGHPAAKHWCKFSSAIPNMRQIRDSVTVRVSVGFQRDRDVYSDRRAAHEDGGSEDLRTLTLVRLVGSDSVELRVLGGPALGGRMTSVDEASGLWQCADSLPGRPDSVIVIQGEWVLRRGSWPSEELNWPVIPHPARAIPD